MGGGHTANSHTRTTPAVPSATRRRFLGFASAMSLDLTTLRRRLQKALGKKFTVGDVLGEGGFAAVLDRKSTRLNSSHGYISYAVFCLKKKKKQSYTYLTRAANSCM